MKKFNYILFLSAFSLIISAQSNKKNTNGSGNQQGVNSPEKPNITEKDFNNNFSNTFLATEKVEFNDISEALKKPETVTSLKLNRQGLFEIPKDISKFINLTELDLSDNEIGDFSAKLVGLNNLKILSLSGNNLTTIPNDVCNLKSLVTLNLSSNKITGGSFSCITGLERLYLNNNELTNLPSGITELQSLKLLYLFSNKLITLDEKLAKLNKLDVLFVQFNKIIEEPKAFENNGIINYIFQPQAINNRYLYKYLNVGSLSNVQSTNNNDGEINLNPSSLSLSEIVENNQYNIKSVDAGNGFRKIKVGDHQYRRYSQFRMRVLFPFSCIAFPTIPVLHWLTSKNHRNNFRLSRIFHAQKKVDDIISASSTNFSKKRVNYLNKNIVIIYSRYLRANNIVAN